METKYLIHETKIDKNCRDIKKAFRHVKFVPAYSVKTNHIPAIVKRFHENGFLTEVVSDMEVEIAKSQGIDMNSIVYNGPIKGPEAYDVASGGGVLCFDSMDDLLFRVYPKGTRCMFRVAINIDNGICTRFGSDRSMPPRCHYFRYSFMRCSWYSASRFALSSSRFSRLRLLMNS